MKTIYVLLSDEDGTLRSKDEPFGVAVSSKEEAERFVKEVKFGYTQSFQEFSVFETTEEAIKHWKEKQNLTTASSCT